MDKIYYYVDESGQHTQGKLFCVAVVIANGRELRNRIEQKLLGVEEETGKRTTKWTKTDYKKKEAYLQAVMNVSDLENSFFYFICFNTRDYVQTTVDTVAKSIQEQVKAVDKCRSVVIVDGLNKKGRQQFATELRKRGVPTEKVHGVKDESTALIRLADALAGFSRDFHEKKPYAENLYSEMAQRYLTRLK